MSAILGVFSPSGQLPDEAVVRRMLRAMGSRGEEHVEIRRDDAGIVAVARQGWELEAGFSGPVLLLDEGDVVVAADAAIYYREDLRRKLAAAGVAIGGDTPSHLILAAYRAWGERCAEQLEGDFAFVLWDRTSRTSIASRDFGGTRSLYHGTAGGARMVASGISAILAHPDCSSELNLAAVGATAAGFATAGDETCYRDVHVLPAGFTLVGREAVVRRIRTWEPPPVDSRQSSSFEDGAEELRELLGRAVEERFAPRGPTAVWLSGGWDSPAVFAAGEEVLRRRGTGEHLPAVSVSYPPGDPGREDELISAIAGRWGAPVHWLQSVDIPIFDQARERASRRDEPFAHAFEMWNRALVRKTREIGSRVALNGNGGDQFFQVSSIYFADLLQSGRWLQLAREWKLAGYGGSGFRRFFRLAVQPNLSTPLLRCAQGLRGGRPLRGHLERVLPPWIDPEFARRHGLVERARQSLPPRSVRGHAAYEFLVYLLDGYLSQVAASVFEFALEGGTEIRFPLCDPRVVTFAASRPRAERRSGRETKRLLRKAMHDLLPAHVLAPRPRKTGVTNGYFDHFVRGQQLSVLADTLSQPLALSDLGIICAKRAREAVNEYTARRDDSLGLSLFFAVQTELWLRGKGIGSYRSGVASLPTLTYAGNTFSVGR